MSDVLAPEPSFEPPARAGNPLVALFFVVLVDVFALTFMLPLMPFLAERFDATPFVVDCLFACYSLCQFVSGPILGQLSDRFGRKPVLLVSQIGTFAGLIVLALAQRIELLFVARMIDGLTAGNISTAQALVTDVSAPDKRTRNYGLVIGIPFGVGFLLGPPISGWVGSSFGLTAPPFVAAALSALSVILTLTLLPKVEPVAAPQPGRWASFVRYAQNKAVVGRLIEMFAFTFAFSTLTSGLALVMQARLGFGLRDVGLLFLYTGIIGLFVQGGLGPASKRFGDARLSLIGAACMVGGYAILAAAGDLTLVLLALGVGGVGSTIVRPAITSLITREVDRAETGLVLGISQSMNSLAMTLAPLLGGLLIGSGRIGAWAGVAGGAAATIWLVRWLLPPSALIEKKTSPPQAV